MTEDRCPCGSGRDYAACCEPFHTGEANPATPEQLMRSRYTAFALGRADYLLLTWHPRTRPSDLQLDSRIQWLSLRIIEAEGEFVEFVARYQGPEGRGFQRERSRFKHWSGRWYYLDGS